MLMPINIEQVLPQAVDICFYNALKQHISKKKCNIGFYFLRAGVVFWILISHFINNQTNDLSLYNMFTALYVIMIVFNVSALSYAVWTYWGFFTNSKLLNIIAQRIQHSRLFDINNVEDTENYHLPLAGVDLKVSNAFYQFQNNIMTHQIDDEYKRRAQRNCSSLIEQQVGIDKRIKFWNQFFNLASIAIFTYTIFLTSQGKVLNKAEFVFIICYLFTEICSRLLLYLILTIIALSPLCCLGFCIYSCLCSNQRNIQLPPVQDASIQIVRECQGDCPICFQDIKIDQKVIVLRCSPKHVFHELCIKGWTRVGKDTCPVCRTVI